MSKDLETKTNFAKSALEIAFGAFCVFLAKKFYLDIDEKEVGIAAGVVVGSYGAYEFLKGSFGIWKSANYFLRRYKNI